MTDKKWCVRFKRTAAGRRCAKYGSSNPKRGRRKCVVWTKTKTRAGKRCQRYEED